MDARIRIIVSREYSRLKEKPTYYMELAGPSTAEKPTDGLITGSKYFEVNTGYEYRFNDTLKTWHVANTAGHQPANGEEF